MELEEGDVVLCTVDRIIGTNVFVKLENGEEGCIVFSEVAAGRIRNIRDYVVPNKKIICKVLRLSNGRIELTLRRVTPKEEKEFKEEKKIEKSYESILKSILEKDAEKVIKKILSKSTLREFLQKSKENEAGKKKLESLIGKENAERMIEVLKNQKQKKAILKKEIFITTSEPNGINLMKNILKKIKDTEIRYISAGRFSLKKEAENAKKADHELKEILDNLKKEAERQKVFLSVQTK